MFKINILTVDIGLNDQLDRSDMTVTYFSNESLMTSSKIKISLYEIIEF